jgi:hypothetical protein
MEAFMEPTGKLMRAPAPTGMRRHDAQIPHGGSRLGNPSAYIEISQSFQPVVKGLIEVDWRDASAGRVTALLGHWIPAIHAEMTAAQAARLVVPAGNAGTQVPGRALPPVSTIVSIPVQAKVLLLN